MVRQLCDAQELAISRAKLYQLLAAVYLRPPDPDFLKFLAGWVASLTEAEGLSSLLSEQIRHGLDTLDEFFNKMEEEREEKFEEAISVEFTRLFRGVTLHYSPLPPYESVYQKEAGRVFSDLTIEVLREYRRFGLELGSPLNGEPPDHISFELEFMHFLCAREAEAWEVNDEDEALRFSEAEREFLEKHLLTWLPRFYSEIRKRDRLGLFCGLADLTEGWVNLDYEQNLQRESAPAETSTETDISLNKD